MANFFEINVVVSKFILGKSDRGFKYEVQRGLKIHEIPDAGF